MLFHAIIGVRTSVVYVYTFEHLVATDVDNMYGLLGEKPPRSGVMLVSVYFQAVRHNPWSSACTLPHQTLH